MILLFATLGIIEYLIGSGVRPKSWLFWLTIPVVMVMVLLSSRYWWYWGSYLFIGYFLLAGIFVAVRKGNPTKLFEILVRLVWGVAYLGFLYPFVYYIRRALPESGGDWLFFLFGVLWLADTLAMFGGKAWGKRRLAPTVSPNKTIAGFLCGLAGGVAVAIIMFFWRLAHVDFILLLGAGLIVAVIGQLGDLVESCWKRAVNVKDASDFPTLLS